MRKTLYFLLVFISLLLIGLRFGIKPLSLTLGIGSYAGLRIQTNKEAKVFIDQRDLGKTPFQAEDLPSGEHLVVLDDGVSRWQGYIKLTDGTLAVINRSLEQTPASSSGEIITLEKGQGGTVISTPTSSDVELDGKLVGKTPLRLENLTSGEHLFIVSHNNFQKRSIRVVAAEGYNLNLSVDLAISDVDFTKTSTTPIQASPQVVIKPTPTGFLRVRAAASVASREIARVEPGQTLVVLEELSGWYKIRLPDGKEGYISSSYADKKTF